MGATYAIVVDTNIVRGAGGPDNDFTKILLAFRATACFLAMSVPLYDEWYKQREDRRTPYISWFAVRWLTEMQTRGRVKWYELDFAVEKKVLSAVNPARIGEVRKDMHLLLTALAADKRIISGDRRLRKDLQEAAKRFSPLCVLVWPPLDQVCAWLINGAQEEIEFILCR